MNSLSRSISAMRSIRSFRSPKTFTVLTSSRMRMTLPLSPACIQQRNIYGLDKEKYEAQVVNVIGKSQFQDFDLTGGVYVVTGGARGLGLSLASGIAEAGGTVHCLDRLNQTDSAFDLARENIHPSSKGSLHYAQVDVTDTQGLNAVIEDIAGRYQRMDGCIAAAGIQKICPALTYPLEDAREMLDVNLLGVFNTACAVARQIYRFPPPADPNFAERLPSPSIVLIASMSGLVANKGLISPIYNASKAGVTQLTRNLAMEWGRPKPFSSTGDSSSSSGPIWASEKGQGISIRVNALSPGHIVTPMVEQNFEEVPELREIWERENMLGRLSRPEEFRGAAIFLLSRASSFMTGSTLVIDGGHTAW